MIAGHAERLTRPGVDVPRGGQQNGDTSAHVGPNRGHVRWDRLWSAAGLTAEAISRQRGAMVQETGYSIMDAVRLAAAVFPLLLAWQLVDTLDWAPWLVLFAIGAVAGLVGWSRSRRLGTLWVALPFWCVWLGLFANAYLDGAPDRHDSEVLRSSHAAKGPGRYVLRDFRRDGGELSLHHNRMKFSSLSDGDQVTLVVGNGLFGWPWLAGIERR